MQVVASLSKTSSDGVVTETIVFDSGLVVCYEMIDGVRVGTHREVDPDDVHIVIQRLERRRQTAHLRGAFVHS